MASNKRGFTLIELLLVITIIGILATLALANYRPSLKRAHDTERKSDLNQYRTALENYAASNNGIYPIHASEYNVSSFCGTGADLEKFISACPTDPTTGKTYYYLSDSGGISYILYADLETAGWWYICSSGISDKTADETAPTLATCP